MADNKEHTLWVDGRPVPVTEQVYKAYYKMKRREKYLEESDDDHGKVNYHALDTNEFGGEEILADSSRNVEDDAILNLFVDKLIRCIAELTAEERFLIDELYYKQKSEVELSKETGIPRTTLQSQKYKLLAKMKKIIEN